MRSFGSLRHVLNTVGEEPIIQVNAFEVKVTSAQEKRLVCFVLFTPNGETMWNLTGTGAISTPKMQKLRLRSSVPHEELVASRIFSFHRLKKTLCLSVYKSILVLYSLNCESADWAIEEDTHDISSEGLSVLSVETSREGSKVALHALESVAIFKVDVEDTNKLKLTFIQRILISQSPPGCLSFSSEDESTLFFLKNTRFGAMLEKCKVTVRGVGRTEEQLTKAGINVRIAQISSRNDVVALLSDNRVALFARGQTRKTIMRRVRGAVNVAWDSLEHAVIVIAKSETPKIRLILLDMALNLLEECYITLTFETSNLLSVIFVDSTHTLGTLGQLSLSRSSYCVGSLGASDWGKVASRYICFVGKQGEVDMYSLSSRSHARRIVSHYLQRKEFVRCSRFVEQLHEVEDLFPVASLILRKCAIYSSRDTSKNNRLCRLCLNLLRHVVQNTKDTAAASQQPAMEMVTAAARRMVACLLMNLKFAEALTVCMQLPHLHSGEIASWAKLNGATTVNKLGELQPCGPISHKCKTKQILCGRN